MPYRQGLHRRTALTLVNTPAGGVMPHGDRMRVLVVEDESIIGLDIVEQLRDAGFTVIGPVGSLEQALALLDYQTFDVALLDINLRGEAVYPAADRLAERAMPFLFLTSYSAAHLPARFAGSTVLEKPVVFERLIDRLRALGAPSPDDDSQAGCDNL